MSCETQTIMQTNGTETRAISSAELSQTFTQTNEMQQASFYMFEKLSKQRRKGLLYFDQIFVNGRHYYTLCRPGTLIEYWCLEKPEDGQALYFIKQLPHVLSHNPAELFAEYKRLEDYFKTYSQISVAFQLAGLTIHDGAYPRGGYANQAEYERYIALYTGGRAHEIAAYLAALAGAPAFNPRDPYPHGHCYLLLLPHEKQNEHYREGQDFLTKQILDRIWKDIDRERVICFEIRAADAHLTLSKRPGLNQILIKCGELADKLRDAFVDGICDHEELTDIYYQTPLVHRD